jgi:glycosyltransferase involved in cell wall biosynthesis
MSSQRLRALVVAHEFSPVSGSECGVGWNIVTRLANHHDITVLYATGSQFSPESYKTAVESHFNVNGPIAGLTCLNVDQPRIVKIIARINSTFSRIGPIGLPILYYIGYNFWQKAVFRKAKELHASEKFDVVHQVTQIAFREPGYLWKMGIPYFWGPTGGLANLPKAYFYSLPPLPKVMESMRILSNFWQFNFVPRVRRANRIASVIYAYSTEDCSAFGKRTNGIVRQMLDVGTYARKNGISVSSENPKIIKGIWCGQISYRKAPGILLKALAMSQAARELVTIKIIGNGPLEDEMHELAEKLELKNIEWIRNVSHDEIFEIMGAADFLVHTSLREATSSVIPEALSMGLPVICHDAFGMSVAINETCGIKIPLVSPETSVKGFNRAIERLISDRDYLNKLKMGVKQRSKEISWETMAETISSDYLAVTEKNKSV